MDILAIVQQHIGDFFKWLGTLFTAKEWHEFFLAAGVVVLMIAATMLVAQVTKFLWVKLPINGDDRVGLVRLMVCAVGTGTGKLLWPATWYLPWWFAGAVLGGGGALLVWWLAWPVFSTKFPNVAAKINAQEKEEGQ